MTGSSAVVGESGRPTFPSALAAWLTVLRCPLCDDGLHAQGRTLRCPRGHSADLARAGYVSLLGGTPARSGDDDDMARARDRFLATGAYEPLRQKLAQRAAACAPSRVLDVGGGTGWYLAGVLDAVPGALGLTTDTSARALRFAARAHERAAAAAWDVFRPFPLADGSVDLLLDVFAPRNPAEFARVLGDRGTLLVVRPAPDHLAQLRAAVPTMVAPDPRKEERLHEALDPLFEQIETVPLRWSFTAPPAAARDLVAMTPSARHVSPEQLGAVEQHGQLEVTASMVLTQLRTR
ncbi:MULTISPECIES: putative RNA methyltransferase [unclassified Brachybacterium]|uniref:putative RNA methyltransferase n=1 Tax=unclassified Brachybacterium TaxID=2623841 RepID=UPI000C80FB51|nr:MULTISPECIES: methyltransferase type 11 [unclassified Brachybacterium]PMC75503.1 methyltransferase type 11 [Brachybacterium sp. UMB0905]